MNHFAPQITNLAQGNNEIGHQVTFYRTHTGHLYLAFDIYFHQRNWKRLWSISEYEIAFQELVQKQNMFGQIPPTERIVIFPPSEFRVNEPKPHNILFPLLNLGLTLDQEIRERTAVVEDLHELTQSSLWSRLQSESVIVRFEFPEKAKIACEQYLLYFVQFLEDIGVEATAELQHDAGQVLFAVTPKNKNEVLDKIRTALHLYLNIPLNTIDGDETDIATQRLASNVYHLRSQLALAQAVLQAKDATIQAQQVTLAHQQYLLTNSVVIDSLVNPSKSDTEDILYGLAQLTKYEGKGFSINLPELFRRLREFLQKH